MEHQNTDKDLLVKGLKNMLIALILFFAGPTIVHISLSNKDKPTYILLLILGVITCLLAIYISFKGLKKIADSIFKKN